MPALLNCVSSQDESGQVPSLLMHAREAGVATVFRSLLPRFRQAGWEVSLDFSTTAAAAFGEPASSVCCPSEIEADLVLCGYDMADIDATGDLLRRAQASGTPSLAILDAWKGIRRFWFEDGSLRALADAICVPDAALRRWLVTHGLPAARVHVIEHPTLDALRAASADIREAVRLAARERLALSGDGRPVLMFFSEPLVSDAGTYSSLAERPLLEHGDPLHEWIERLYGDSHVLVMSRHPVEPRMPLERWRSSEPLSLEECLFVADQAVGLGTTVMAYAAACGIPLRNVHDLLAWSPCRSGYEPDIWQHIADTGAFGTACRGAVMEPGTAADILDLAGRLVGQRKRPSAVDGQHTA